MAPSEPERLAIVETKLNNLADKGNAIENSLQGLHGKFDTLTKMIIENYVTKDTFEQWKKTQIEKEKNKWLDRILWVFISNVIVILVLSFLGRIKG